MELIYCKMNVGVKVLPNMLVTKYVCYPNYQTCLLPKVFVTNYKRITTHKLWISTKMNISYMYKIYHISYIIYHVSFIMSALSALSSQPNLLVKDLGPS